MRRSVICCMVLSMMLSISFTNATVSSDKIHLIETNNSKDLKRGYPNTRSVQAIDIDCTTTELPAICVQDIMGYLPPATTNCGSGGLVITSGMPLLLSGTAGCVGAVYFVQYNAEDNCGQMAACAQDFILVAPTITCPDNMTGLSCTEALPAGPVTIQDFLDAGGTIDGSCEDDFTISFSDSPDPSTLDFCTAAGLTVTRTFTISDACGTPMTTECTQTFTYLVDTTAPTASNPVTLTINCSTAPAPDITVVTDEMDDCTAIPTVAFVSDASNGASCPEVITRTYSITDACGNSTTVQQIINLDDTMVPVLTCPANLILECDGDYTTEINDWLLTATATDGCSSTVTITNDYVAGTLPLVSCDLTTGLTVTFNATDDCGNEAVPCTASIILDDTVPPVITCPADVEIACGADTSSASTGVATSTDACGNVTITQSDVSVAGCGNTETITRTWTATDACGNTDTCVQTITVVDNTLPVITCPTNMTLECGTDTSSASTGMATATDACGDVTITQSDVSVAGCGNTETITRTWTATDACGNIATCEQIITVVDTTAPVITCPAGVIDLNCSSALPAPITDINDFIVEGGTITEICGGTTISSSDSADPSTFSFCSADGPFEVVRTYTVTDDCGNIGQCTQTFVYLEDAEAPTFTCGADLTINADPGLCTAMVTIAVPTPTDDCTPTGDITLVNDMNGMADASGNYPVGTTTIVWTATDNCGNTSTCTINVTVNDNEDPVVTCPADLDITCDISEAPAATSVVEFEAQGGTITDNCMSGGIAISHVDVSDGNTCPEVITRTYTITQGSSTVTCIQTITINDLQAPTMTCGADFTINNDLGVCSAMATIAVPTVSDNCGVTSLTNDMNGMADASGDYPVGTTTITWTALDACGNSATCVVNLTVVDNEAPMITCPADVMDMCDITNLPAATTVAELIAEGGSASDNCDMDLTLTSTDISDGAMCPEVVTRTYTVTDDGGLTATCVQIITIDDTTLPIITCPGNMTLECGADTSPTNTGMATATDNCTATSMISITSSDVSVPACANTETITRTWTATDDCGNAATCVQTITVQDTELPVITCPSNLILECDGDYTAEINNWLLTATATDGCSTPVITNNYTVGNLPAVSCDQTTGVTVIFTATDACGNTATCSATILIDDTTVPIITCPSDLVLECDGDYATEINNWLLTATATDACSTPVITTDYVAGTLPMVSCDATAGLTVVFTATDDCDNIATCMALIIITDTIEPVITCPADVTDLTCADDLPVGATLPNDFVVFAGGTIDEECSTTTVTFEDDFDPATDFDFCTGSDLLVTRTYTITDDCGNFATCEQTFTFLPDTEAPVVDCTVLEDITLECGDTDNATLIEDWLLEQETALLDNATEDCGDMTVTNNYITGAYPSETVCCNNPTMSGLVVTFILEDECGNSTSCTASIILEDTLPPLLDCSKVAAPLVLECNAANQAMVIADWLTTSGDFLLSTAIDQCTLPSNIMTVSNDYDGTIPDVSCEQTDGLTVNFIVTDCCGNSASCASEIFVDDLTVPTITCPADLVLECGDDANFDGLISDWLDTAIANDLCGGVEITNDYDGSSIPDFNCDLVDGLEVTFTATDDCDNEVTCVASIFQSDTTGPDINCSNNLILGCDGDYEQEIIDWLALATATDDCDTDVEITNDYMTGTIPPLSCDLSDGIMVTFTATDDCGNSTGCTAMMYLDDNFNPEITCPANLILECDGDYEDEINEWLTTVTATDGCDASVTITNDYVIGDLPDLSCDQSTGLTVTFTATDDCDNSATCTATIILTDTVDPVITCPADLVLECDGDYEAEITAWLATIAAVDACDMDLVIENDYDGSIPDVSCDLSTGILVTFTATDDCENRGLCTATIFIDDTVLPTIVCPADLILECDGDYEDEINDWLELVTASDVCDTDVEITDDYDGTIPAVSCDASTGLLVTFTATDDCDNEITCTASIIVTDTVDPELKVPAEDVTVECDGSSDPIQDFADWLANAGNAEVDDACDEMLIITNNSMGLSNDCGLTGTETVTFTITDACNNAITTTATFTITDNTPPEITVEAMDFKIECSDSDALQMSIDDWLADNGGAEAEDECGDVTWTNDSSGISDDCGGTGFMFVTFTATDECGNTATTQATFTAGDETPPEITVEAMDMTVECDGTPDPGGAFAAWLADNGGAQAEDVCGDVIWSNDSMGLSDDCGATGSETVVFTATDECDNSSTTTATFTIEDTTDPVWTNAPMDMTVECDGTADPGGAFAAWLNSFTGMDGCGNVVVTNNSMGLSDDCGATGSETVTFTLTDDCDNSIMASATFTVEDTTDPVWVNEPMDVTMECDGVDPTTAFMTWLNSFTGMDACGDVVVTNNSMGLSDECGMTGSETVTFTLTDDCDNFITADATFTVVDNTAPLIDPMAMDMTVECDGTADPLGAFAAWLANNGGAVATDACGMVTWSNSSMGLSDDCGATGSETVTFTATDECGNTSNTTATFTIEDTTAPLIDPMAMNMTVECDGTADPGGAFAAWLANNGGANATDICGSLSWSNNSMGLSDDCGATGSETVTFTATDECGNTSTTSATFTIEDTSSPVIDPMAMDMTVECNGMMDPMGAFADWLTNNGGAMATDACGMVAWSNNSMGLTDMCGITGSETVIFTATDDCGNTSTTEATFIIEDTTAPVIDPAASDMTVECDGTSDPNDAFANWLADQGGAEATDICGMVSWTNNSMGLSDDCGATGSETVIFTATDECDNTSTTSATFTIEDTTDPVWVDAPTDMAIECDGTTDPMGAFAAWLTSFSGSDICGNATVTNNSTGLSDDCGATGSETVLFTLTDECGNDISASATFTIEDTTPPVIDCPTLLPFGTNDSTCDADVVIPEPPTSDVCGTVSVSWTASNGTSGTGDASGTYPLGTTTITYTATDACGLTSTCTQDIIVIDDVGPALACANEQCLILDANGMVTVPATSFVLSAIDNCSPIASTQAMIVGAGNPFTNDVSFDCNSKGVLMVMVEVADEAGNTTQCNVEVTIKDTSAPSLDLAANGNNTCLPDVTINCEYLLDTTDMTPLGTIVFDPMNQMDIIIDGIVVGMDGIFTDNCDDGLFILSDTADDTGVHPQCGVGDLIRTIVVSDASGNTTACVQTITIMDVDPFSCDEVTWPADYTIEGCEMGSTDPEVTGEPIFVIDKCSLVGTNYEDIVIDTPLSGCPFIERTWTLLDWCQYDPNDPGSEGICTYTQILTYVNSVPPTIVSGGQDTIICANPNTCIGDVNLLLTANDDCTDSLDIAYTWSLDLNSAGITIVTGVGNTLFGNYPQGNHTVTWEVEDRCGNVTTQVMAMEIKDCKAPLLACKYGLATTLLPKLDGCVVIWANDFVKSVEDNCTDLEDISISFSADITDTDKKFTCDDLGDQQVEIWATDSNGNQTFCTTFINIQDNLNVCTDNGNGNLMISGRLSTEMGDPIALAEVYVESTQMNDMDMSDGVGIYSFENLTNNENYMVAPEKNDDADNGVSTIDLVLIQKHILGISELDSPYKLIAADANSSESVTAVDLIEIRKLILGIYEEYPHNTSWRFVDEEFVFPDPSHPWPFTEEVMNTDMNSDQMDVDFIGVKIGDVNNTVEVNADGETASSRSSSSLELVVDEQEFNKGDIVKVEVKAKDFNDIIGLQYTLNLEASHLSILAVESAVLNVTELNMGQPTADQLTFSWNAVNAKSVADNEILYILSFVAHADGMLSRSIELNSSITAAEAYDTDLDKMELELSINTDKENTVLYQNVPNPFSEYTDISFTLDKAQDVELSIYGADGKRIWQKEAFYSEGAHFVEIHKKDLGNYSGVLYLEMKADQFISTKKMIYLND